MSSQSNLATFNDHVITDTLSSDNKAVDPNSIRRVPPFEVDRTLNSAIRTEDSSKLTSSTNFVQESTGI